MIHLSLAILSLPLLTVEVAKADFDLMRRAVEEAHAGIYRYTPKKSLDAAFDAARRSISGPVSRTELRRIDFKASMPPSIEPCVSSPVNKGAKFAVDRYLN